jgi:DNA topoisomerase VI subunit B
VDEGLYFSHLNRFLERFSREQVHCLLMEDLKTSPEDFLEQVYEIVGVRRDFRPDLLDEKFHQRRARPKFQKLYNLVISLSKKVGSLSPVAKDVIQGLRRTPLPDLFHALNRGPSFPEMSQEFERKLANYYRADTQKLSSLLERDLVGSWIAPHLTN